MSINILTTLKIEADACRDMHNTMRAKIYEKAAKEIERLQSNNENLLLDNCELRNEIERLRGLILEVMTTRPHDPSRPYEVFTADISWKPRAAKACGIDVLEATRFVSSGMVIKEDEDGAA